MEGASAIFKVYSYLTLWRQFEIIQATAIHDGINMKYALKFKNVLVWLSLAKKSQQNSNENDQGDGQSAIKLTIQIHPLQRNPGLLTMSSNCLVYRHGGV